MTYSVLAATEVSFALSTKLWETCVLGAPGNAGMALNASKDVVFWFRVFTSVS